MLYSFIVTDGQAMQCIHTPVPRPQEPTLNNFTLFNLSHQSPFGMCRQCVRVKRGQEYSRWRWKWRMCLVPAGTIWRNFKTRWRATARPYINYGISFPMYDLHERYINLPLLENRSESLSRETLIHGHPVMANTLQYQFQALHIKRWHNK